MLKKVSNIGRRIGRRKFLALLGSALMGVFLWVRFIYTPSKRLQAKLEELGFSVEVEELDKFWTAYLDISQDSPVHMLRVLRTYAIEPRDQNVALFLLSSNAFDKKEEEKVQFVVLYSPYKRPCYHPFLQKA